MTVTFFGHRVIPCDISERIRNTLVYLIEEKNAYNFYVGNNGEFDKTVCSILKELKKTYPHIRYAVVLAYLPLLKKDKTIKYENTVVPEGIERVPQKYAICARNKWMIEQANTVITYVIDNTGGAAQFKAVAERKGKTIINLAEF